MRSYLLIICLLASQLSLAQDPFSASWPFDGATAGSASHPNAGAGGADLVGVNLNNLFPYVAGQNNLAASIGGWSQTGGCNFNEFIQVTVQPLNGQSISLNGLSFFVGRSASGPPTIRVRSSIDGFGSDIVQVTTSESFQTVSVGLGGSYANQTGAISFRIHACPPHSGGTLRLDQLTINGTVTSAPLPVSLLYFRAQPQPTTADQANRVTLNWATTWERDADRFEIQRSRTLSEFGTIGQIPARGTTETRQLYSFSDDWPDAGITYYRLRQVDTDGTATYSNIVAAVLDDSTPTLAVLDSETPGTIRVRGRNLSGAVFTVVSMTGQVIPVTVQTEANGSIGLFGKMGTGLYVVRAEIGSATLVQRALVR